MNLREAYTLLGFEELYAKPKEVRSKYLVLSRTIHPDNGGSADAFSQLNDAYDIARRHAENLACTECDGKKEITEWVGFSPVKHRCPRCAGSGLEKDAP